MEHVLVFLQDALHQFLADVPALIAIRKKIDEISPYALPIVVGGTGLYVKSLLLGYNFGGAGVDEDYRKKLEEILRVDGIEKLAEMLKDVSPSAYEKIDKKNPHRLIRALEIARFSGEKKEGECEYDALIFALNLERQKLYERINRRVDIMLENGLVEEARALLKAGVSENAQAMHAIGYKEVVQYLKGEVSFERMKELIKQHSRNYAKRQLTFLRGMKNVNFVDIEEKNYQKKMENMIERWKNG